MLQSALICLIFYYSTIYIIRSRELLWRTKNGVVVPGSWRPTFGSGLPDFAALWALCISWASRRSDELVLVSEASLGFLSLLSLLSAELDLLPVSAAALAGWVGDLSMAGGGMGGGGRSAWGGEEITFFFLNVSSIYSKYSCAALSCEPLACLWKRFCPSRPEWQRANLTPALICLAPARCERSRAADASCTLKVLSTVLATCSLANHKDLLAKTGH